LRVYGADIADVVVVDHADVRTGSRKRHADDDEEKRENVLVVHGFDRYLVFCVYSS